MMPLPVDDAGPRPMQECRIPEAKLVQIGFEHRTPGNKVIGNVNSNFSTCHEIDNLHHVLNSH